MKPAVLRQLNQANRALFKLKSMAIALNLPVDIQCNLFDKLITPIALYGCEVWGLKHIELIERFHQKFLKQLLKVSKYTANCMVYGELGRHRLKILLQKRLINFWLHLKSDNRRQLSSILYSLMLKMNNIAIACDTKSWIADVKGTLDLAGFSNCWIAEEINHKWLTKSLARRLNDIDIQNWHSEVSSNSLCAFYRLIKNDNRLEPYLTDLKYKHRVSLTKFKCGNSNLASSINRRNHTDQQPVCALCDSGNQGED